MALKWWASPDSNRDLMDFKSILSAVGVDAHVTRHKFFRRIRTDLQYLCYRQICSTKKRLLCCVFVAEGVGLEPTHNGFRDRRATNTLPLIIRGIFLFLYFLYIYYNIIFLKSQVFLLILLARCRLITRL